MNMDQLQGRMQKVAGSVEQAVGHALGNRRMAIAGLTKKLLGSAQMVHGDVKLRVQKRKLTPF